MAERVKEARKGMFPLMRAFPHELNTSQKPHPLIPTLLGYDFKI
jgi:hypothetical protein